MFRKDSLMEREDFPIAFCFYSGFQQTGGDPAPGEGNQLYSVVPKVNLIQTHLHKHTQNNV